MDCIAGGGGAEEEAAAAVALCRCVALTCAELDTEALAPSLPALVAALTVTAAPPAATPVQAAVRA